MFPVGTAYIQILSRKHNVTPVCQIARNDVLGQVYNQFVIPTIFDI